MSEEWRDVQDFPGYRVSSAGRVQGKSGRLLKPWPNGTGYVQVTLTDGAVRRAVTVHRLVLEVSRGPGGDLQGAHLNGDPTDNRLENLSWATPAENNEHKRSHGTHRRGAAVGTARLTETDVRSIRSALEAGEAQRSIAVRFGVHFGTINAIARGKSWRHVA
ncbi:HNH endonuclease [Streptomyces sp. NPDC058960]|uniref:HNH endonuclease n=1 Tax=Streptomyces sp. NPDC058960 TaxID=3346679 RepID=UPI0036949C5F